MTIEAWGKISTHCKCIIPYGKKVLNLKGFIGMKVSRTVFPKHCWVRQLQLTLRVIHHGKRKHSSQTQGRATASARSLPGSRWWGLMSQNVSVFYSLAYVWGRVKGYISHTEINPQLTVMLWIVFRNVNIHSVTISPVTFQQTTPLMLSVHPSQDRIHCVVNIG